MTTEDRFLGGQLTLRQPKQGFRAGLDSVMLAAAVPAVPGDTALELGSGAGVAALCLARRVAGVHVTGIEIQGELVALATVNAEANALDGATFVQGRAEQPPPELPRDHFDHVMINPPFFVDGRDDASPDAFRRIASIADDELLTRWAKTARTHLHAKGLLTAIVPADRLAALLSALATGFGNVTIFPLWPRAGEPAKRIIVSARKGSRAALSLKPGLVLHGAGGDYSEGAEAILRRGGALNL